MEPQNSKQNTTPLTPKEQEALKDQCDHVGTHGPISQNVVVNPGSVLIIASHACMYCGKVFTSITPIDTAPKDPKKSILGDNHILS